MRKLVTLKRITDIRPIEGADAIELAVVGGWQSVVKKGEFSVGDPVAYFEIDAFLPASVPAFESFVARSSKTVVHPDTNEEVTGHILKTARLRGALSQGLVIAPSEVGLLAEATQEQVDEQMKTLGVFKWEAPLPAGTGGQQVGNFATDRVQKTDSERVQNLSDEFLAGLVAEDWVPTEKVDGTSATFIKEDGKIRAFSRNFEIRAEGNSYGSVIERFGLDELMPEGAIIQGEIFGPGIQGNPVRVPQISFLVFNVKFIDGHESTAEFDEFVATHKVPTVDLTLPRTIEEAVAQVFDRKSLINPQVQSEGVVWWNTKGIEFSELGFRPNFKAINNKFLLKQK